MPEEECPRGKACLCDVKIEDLSVIRDSELILDKVTFTVHCGELTALIGANGAGKTTLLRAILGQTEHTGRVIHESHDGGELHNVTVGYIPQYLIFDRGAPVSVSDFLIAGRSRRPVCFGRNKAGRAMALEALRAVSCEELADQPLGTLSGGELQRVMLAAALHPMPQLLILDEPVSGVDAAGAEQFYKTIDYIKENNHIAIAMVSHDLDLVHRYADKVVLINRRVLCQGTPDEVYDSEQFRDTFLGYAGKGGTEQ